MSAARKLIARARRRVEDDRFMAALAEADKPRSRWSDEELVEKVMDFLYYFEPEVHARLDNPRRRAKLLEWLS